MEVGTHNDNFLVLDEHVCDAVPLCEEARVTESMDLPKTSNEGSDAQKALSRLINEILAGSAATTSTMAQVIRKTIAQLEGNPAAAEQVAKLTALLPKLDNLDPALERLLSDPALQQHFSEMTSKEGAESRKEPDAP